jgi:hypothetical protein
MVSGDFRVRRAACCTVISSVIVMLEDYHTYDYYNNNMAGWLS